MSEGHSEEYVKKQIRGYMVVFAALAGLTVLTVAASYIDVGSAMHLTIALLIALVKGGLVAAYFMHLISEKMAIYALLILTVFFFLLMIFLPLAGYYDPITAGS